jgi:predicted RNA binding protein YcfA (HicA-like mRNA interferase family)
MGGQFPPLTPSEVEEILKNAGFHLKRSDGSHFQWEGDVEGQRRMVTVDHLGGRMSETFGPELTRSMIRQSGMSRKTFYSYRK